MFLRGKCFNLIPYDVKHDTDCDFSDGYVTLAMKRRFASVPFKDDEVSLNRAVAHRL